MAGRVAAALKRAVRDVAVIVFACSPSLPAAAQQAAETAALETRARASESAPSRADAYDELVREALLEVDAEHWLEAHTLFARAHEIAPNARTLRGLGVTAFELRHYADAVRDLSAALVEARNPLPDDLRAEVQGALDRARRFVGTLHLEVEPREATVHIDGNDVREREVVLDAGEYVVSVAADSYWRESLTVRISGGDARTISVQLIRIDVSPRRAQPEGDVTAAGAAEADRETGSLLESWWFWTLAGVVVAGTAVAVVAATQSDDAPGERGIGGVHEALTVPNHERMGLHVAWP